MKYRIIVSRIGTAYPYRVQMKKNSFFSLWTEIDASDSAEYKLMEYIKAKIPVPGTVVKTYDESDIIVAKLKGTI